MTTTEIQEHIQQIYGVEMSIELVSAITDTVMDDVKAWQNRPLNAVYPIVYLDALRVKARINGHVQTRVIYLVIGVNLGGTKEILGLWACESEGAKFWLGKIVPGVGGNATVTLGQSVDEKTRTPAVDKVSVSIGVN
jgi:putative transposase